VLQRHGGQYFGSKPTDLFGGRHLASAKDFEGNGSPKVAVNGSVNDPHPTSIDLFD
jgi:hypothetical protein